jgi:hypothetical protein
VFGFGMTNGLLGQHGRLGVFDLAAGVVGIGGVVGGLRRSGDPSLDLGLVVVDHPAIVEVQPARPAKSKERRSADQGSCVAQHARNARSEPPAGEQGE